MALQPGVSPLRSEDIPQTVAVWEASVRATHDFVAPSDIEIFRPIVGDALHHLTSFCVRNEQDKVAGYISVAEGMVQMLFIDPLWRGQGVGRRLMRYAIDTLGATTVDVNEQNPQALGFYLHMGFEVVGRSELDGMGKPYPILHMRLGAPARALRWISDILQHHAIPYQACGGLAARAYGSTRELVDIDLNAPLARFDEIRPEVNAYITWGPAYETGARWDLTYVKLDYEGQKIEISDSDTLRIFDTSAQQWVDQVIDFGASMDAELYGVRVPVIPKAQLIAYKSMLAREVDLIDIQAMQAQGTHADD
jgi:putative acetyltransferase